MKICIELKKDYKDILTIFLDNNSSHKNAFQYNLWLALKSNEVTSNFKVNYEYIAPYSPDYNLAEYAIHLLKLNVLHHSSPKLTLEEKEIMIKNYLKNNHLFTKDGVKNTINHILKL